MLMSRTSTLILLGVLVILSPFLGLPATFRSLITVILGACVLGAGLSERARAVHSRQPSPEQPPAPQSISPIS